MPLLDERIDYLRRWRFYFQHIVDKEEKLDKLREETRGFASASAVVTAGGSAFYFLLGSVSGDTTADNDILPLVVVATCLLLAGLILACKSYRTYKATRVCERQPGESKNDFPAGYRQVRTRLVEQIANNISDPTAIELKEELKVIFSEEEKHYSSETATKVITVLNKLTTHYEGLKKTEPSVSEESLRDFNIPSPLNQWEEMPPVVSRGVYDAQPDVTDDREAASSISTEGLFGAIGGSVLHAFQACRDKLFPPQNNRGPQDPEQGSVQLLQVPTQGP